MPFQFQLESRDGSARAGRLVTAHGAVLTPVFMPVGTVATVKGVSQDMLEDLGVEILLANTYHLYLRPGVDAVQRLGGLHGFMSWDRAILTDSGGFQVWSLSQLRKVSEEGVEFRSHLDGSPHVFTPESATAAQIALGADIIMAFDECTEHPAERARARESMEMTARWARRCKAYFEEHKQEVPWAGERAVGGQWPAASKEADGKVASGQWAVASAANDQRPTTNDERVVSGQWAVARESEDRVQGAASRANDQRPTTNDSSQALFGIIQGGMYPDLRRESAERTLEIGFPGYAIGGLSVGEPRDLTRQIVGAALEHLPPDKPRYLMGVGTPEEIVEYIGMGVDMMDCVLPTRAGRHGLLFTSQGRLSIKSARYAADDGPLDPSCGCRVCARYSRAYLRHLYASNEVLAQVLNTVHNLFYYLDTVRRVRHSIALGEFAKFLSGIRSCELSPPIQAQREDTSVTSARPVDFQDGSRGGAGSR